MEEPERFLHDELGNVFTLKEKSIGPPTQYLGNKVSQVTLEMALSDGVSADLSMSKAQ